MKARPQRRAALNALLFAVVALSLILWRLLPLDKTGTHLPAPDLLMAVSFAWVLRRPREVPVLLITGARLVEDLLLLRPPGLGALMLLWTSEAARSREARWREAPFLVEWLRVSILMALTVLGTRIAMVIMLQPIPPLGLVLIQLISSILVYAPVVGVLRLVFGVRRPSHLELERQSAG